MIAWWRLPSAIVVFCVPFAVHAIYQPLNAAWTVRRFGCGCPPLHDTGDFRFTANHLNAIGWLLIFAALCSTWWWLTRREGAKSRWMLAGRMAGIYVLFFTCMNRFAKEVWL